ncbi:SIS domain-containing protein OS=Streptomyces alboniger OX=132473 GN=CP975_10000 PE=4 SV=1 [Streptomyces alboniger]
MDAVRVALLREVLAGTEWLGATRRFAGTLRAGVVPHGGGLLLVGTEAYEPWHLAAHLVDEAAWSGTPELTPTLVRHRVLASDPAHLSTGLGRIEAARRGETLLVVAPDAPDGELLTRVHDARRAGATVLALGSGDRDLTALSHEALAVPESPDLDLDTVQHLVSAAAGENALPEARGRRRLRDRLSRLADQLTSPPPTRW